MMPEEQNEIEVLRGLVQANAEHAESLVRENADLRKRLAAAEGRPPAKTWEAWRAEAYEDARNAAVDKLSEDVKALIEQQEQQIAILKLEIRQIMDVGYDAARKLRAVGAPLRADDVEGRLEHAGFLPETGRRALGPTEERLASANRRRRLHYWKLVATRARASRLEKLYKKWRGTAEQLSTAMKDAWARADSEATRRRVEAAGARNDALEEAAHYFDSAAGFYAQKHGTGDGKVDELRGYAGVLREMKTTKSKEEATRWPHFRWSCDECPTTEVRRPFGLPDGWTYELGALTEDGRNRIVHRCPACTKKHQEAKP